MFASSSTFLSSFVKKLIQFSLLWHFGSITLSPCLSFLHLAKQEIKFSFLRAETVFCKVNVDFKYVYAVVLNSSLTGAFSDFLLWSKTYTLLATTTVSLNNTRIGNHSTSRSAKWSRSLTSLLEINVLTIRTLNLWIWSVLTASYLHSRLIWVNSFQNLKCHFMSMCCWQKSWAISNNP